jgi:phage protein D/phage baseplate assembly protein gpV
MPENKLLAHFYLKLGGSDAPEDLMQDLGNVEVDDSLHIPDMFTIQVRDPHLKWADSPLLKIGQEVEILARSAGKDQTEPKRLLVGEITTVEPDYPYGGAPVVVLRGYDRAHRLHRGKKTRSFVQMTDSDIVTKIAREYGLKPEVDDTTEVYPYILENNQSDFEFIMERARRLGFAFLVDDQSLLFKQPGSLPSDTVELEYGTTLRQFRPRMTTASQFKEVIVKSWDPVNKRDILGHAGASTPGGGGGNGGGPLVGLAGAVAGAAGGALGEAAGGASSRLNSLAQQAMGFAANEAGGAVQKAKSEALGALPAAARGPAAQLAEAGLQKGLALVTDQLGGDAASALGALASGDSAAVAQVGMELGAKVVEKAFGEAGVLVVTQHPVRSQSEADQLAKSIFKELTSGNLQAEGVASGNALLTAGCKVKLNALGSKFSGEYFVSHTRHTYDPEDGYLTEFAISGRSPDTFTDLLTGGAGTNPGTNGNNGPAGVVIGLVTNNQDPDGQGRVKVKFPWLSDDQESNWARLAMPMAGKNRGLFLLPEVGDEVLVMFEQGDVNHPYVIGAVWNGSDTPPLSASQAVNGSGAVVQRIFKTRAGHTVIFDDSDDSPGIQIIDKTGNNKIVIDSKDNKLTIELDGDVKLTSKGKIEIEAQTDMNFKANGSMSLKASSGMDLQADGSVKVKGATIELN